MKPEPTSKKKALKIERYATMTAAFLATASIAQAGIVYTDLDPDETAENSNVLIDMDGDGIWDFRAEHFGYTTGNSTFFFSNQITRLRGNTASGPGYGWVNNGFTFQAAALSSGQSIGAASPITTSDWATVGAYKIFTSPGSSSISSRGDWNDVENKFLGVSFDLADGVHYGWIRASISTNYNTFTIHDWAYEEAPGVPIVAGDMGGCNSTIAPQNPISVVGATSVTLSWDAVAGSVGCQLQGSRTSPPGPSGTAVVSGSGVTSHTIPLGPLGPGTTWSWQVRCACSISPLDPTPFSAAQTFTTPLLREGADLIKSDLHPNPAADRANLKLEQPAIHDTEIRISDILGREVDFILLPKNASNIDLDLSALEPGIYYVQVGEMEALPIEVMR